MNIFWKPLLYREPNNSKEFTFEERFLPAPSPWEVILTQNTNSHLSASIHERGEYKCYRLSHEYKRKSHQYELLDDNFRKSLINKQEF